MRRRRWLFRLLRRVEDAGQVGHLVGRWRGRGVHARVAVAHVRRVAFDVGEASVAQLAVGVHRLDDGPRWLQLLLAGPCWRESRQLAVAYG